MNLSFKNRIALHYMIATAIIIAVVFGFVFFIVQSTVYQNLDNDLSIEVRKHQAEIRIDGDRLRFINKAEWEEHEHRQAQVNPVFIQLIDRKGRLMDKSPNLKEQQLPFSINRTYGDHFDTQLNNRAIRQVQVPIEQQGEVKGYILAAMSLESSIMVIGDLRNVLLISYPIVLLGLFFISRYLAGRSIIPIRNITETTGRITRHNLNERVTLPGYKDELYELSASINELLQRIENALRRERQFTSDASHELRTPLASLRGNLEVLIRKSREREEYEEKVRYSLKEIDRMSNIIDQLLLLARFDSNENADKQKQLELQTQIDDMLSHYHDELTARNLRVEIAGELPGTCLVPGYYAYLILDNIFNNAVKYSHPGGVIRISYGRSGGRYYCKISDDGVGIREEDIPDLFNPFFRSDALEHKHISGTGLGLSIAQKAADAIRARLTVRSELHKGTEFTILF